MRVLDDPTQFRFESGSFTGFRPLRQLGSSYLSSLGRFKQPLCGNEEGWGPLSPHRYDFTPCFIDVWVASVAAFGIIVGGIAIAWLVKHRTSVDVPKNWHFWLKQVCFLCEELQSNSSLPPLPVQNHCGNTHC